MEKFRNLYLALKFTISYFSTIPVTFKENDNINNKTTLSFFIYFLPITGLILSTAVVIFYNIFESSLYFALLGSVIYMLLYGFIHTEAIADVVDALYAKHSGVDPYKVIKEPAIGAMGLLYTASFLILKVSTLTYLLLNELFFEFIVISMLSRSSVIYLIHFYQFRSTFINSIKKYFETVYVISFLLLYILIGFILLGIDTIYLTLATAFLTIFTVKKLDKNLGFINGDVLGFNIEVTELLLMIFCIIISTGF